MTLKDHQCRQCWWCQCSKIGMALMPVVGDTDMIPCRPLQTSTLMLGVGCKGINQCGVVRT